MRRHLNWTIAIAYIVFWLLVYVAMHIGNLPLCILASIGALAVLCVAGWAMTEKGRGSWYYFILWWIPLIGLVILLVLPNKKIADRNSKANVPSTKT